MNFFFKDTGNGNVMLGVPDTETKILDHVPAAVYTIHYDKKHGTVSLIKKVDRYPDQDRKIYGNPEAFNSILLSDFARAPHGLGAIFYGNKGCGKTLQAESFCNKAIHAGYPIIVVSVDDPVDPTLLSMVAHGVGRCVIYIDEFGKAYPLKNSDGANTGQDTLIQMFSSTLLNNVMFLLTENSIGSISSVMVDRPGRIKYAKHFAGFGVAELKEMLEGKPVHRAVMDILEVYYARYTDQIDALELIAEHAVNATTPDEFYERIAYFNIQKPRLPIFNIEATGSHEGDNISYGGRLSSTMIYVDGVPHGIPREAVRALVDKLKKEGPSDHEDSSYGSTLRERAAVRFNVGGQDYLLVVDEFRPYEKGMFTLNEEGEAEVDYTVYRGTLTKYGPRSNMEDAVTSSLRKKKEKKNKTLVELTAQGMARDMQAELNEVVRNCISGSVMSVEAEDDE